MDSLRSLATVGESLTVTLPAFELLRVRRGSGLRQSSYGPWGIVWDAPGAPPAWNPKAEPLSPRALTFTSVAQELATRALDKRALATSFRASLGVFTAKLGYSEERTAQFISSQSTYAYSYWVEGRTAEEPSELEVPSRVRDALLSALDSWERQGVPKGDALRSQFFRAFGTHMVQSLRLGISFGLRISTSSSSVSSARSALSRFTGSFAALFASGSLDTTSSELIEVMRDSAQFQVLAEYLGGPIIGISEDEPRTQPFIALPDVTAALSFLKRLERSNVQFTPAPVEAIADPWARLLPEIRERLEIESSDSPLTSTLPAETIEILGSDFDRDRSQHVTADGGYGPGTAVSNSGTPPSPSVLVYRFAITEPCLYRVVIEHAADEGAVRTTEVSVDGTVISPAATGLHTGDRTSKMMNQVFMGAGELPLTPRDEPYELRIKGLRGGLVGPIRRINIYPITRPMM